jgi:methyl-accepting chemotaxis protein
MRSVMGLFNNLKVTGRLLGSFALVIVLACLVGGAGVRGLTDVQGRMRTVTSVSTPALVNLLHVHDFINFGMRGSRGVILASTAAKIADVSGDVENARTGALKAFQTYLALPGKSAHETAVAASFGKNFQDWLATVEQVKNQAAVNTPAGKAAATKISLGANADAIDRMDPDLQELLAINQSAVDNGRVQTDAAVNSAITEEVAALCIAVFLALVTGLLLARSIIRPLRRLADTASLVASGDTSTRIDVSRSDELGVLARSFQSVSQYLSRIATAATAVAGGDLQQKVVLAGKQDTLSQAFNSMVTDLQKRTSALVSAETHTREQAERLATGVTQLIEDLAPVADGDLTTRPRMSAEAGDVAVIADFTGVLIDTFSGVARQVRSASIQVQANSDQLTERIQQLATQVQERTIQVNETAVVAGQIADSAAEVLSSIVQVNRTTQDTVDNVEQGNTAVAQTLERMDMMRATMIQATRQIKKLSDSSLAMTGTVGMVLQFAGDLELLADNAQIEAARHKEAGGVFTAVAEQTGRLAEDAQKALSEIQAAVLTNRQETAEVGRQMEQVATEVVASARAVEEARSAFNNITASVRELRGFVERVNGVASAQVQVAETVGTAMGQITAFFGQMADGVHLSEGDAAALSHTIERLQASVSTLKLEATPAEFMAPAA